MFSQQQQAGGYAALATDDSCELAPMIHAASAPPQQFGQFQQPQFSQYSPAYNYVQYPATAASAASHHVVAAHSASHVSMI